MRIYKDFRFEAAHFLPTPRPARPTRACTAIRFAPA